MEQYLKQIAEYLKVRSASLFPPNQVGIDLGTSNTLIYQRTRGIVINEPSVVTLDRKTGKTKAVGRDAKRMLGKTPASIVAARPLSGGVIADVDVAEIMLRHFLSLLPGRKWFARGPSVIIAVPSGITELERRAVRATATVAGAREVKMIAEPMAAALGLGLPVHEPLGHMVVDIGGGTTEVAVIALSDIVTSNSIRIAGDTIDAHISDFMRKGFNLAIGDTTAEDVKLGVGSAHPQPEEIRMPVKGRDLVTGVPRMFHAYSQDVRDSIREPVMAIAKNVVRTLEVTPPELASDIVDHGIYLTGGGALLPGLAELLREETGLEVHVDTEPLTAVIRGIGRIIESPCEHRSLLID